MFHKSLSVQKSGRVTLVALLVLLTFVCYGQKTKTQLEQEKRENLKRIAEAEKILTDTEHEKNATIGQLQAINQQISAREGLISSLSQEVSLLDSEIGELNIIVRALERDLKDLKEEYGRMIYSSYKANKGYSKLTFLFSSRTFNQLFRRLKYLEQYSDARQLQAREIEIVAKELRAQQNEVEIKRSEQRRLLNQQVSENKKLIGLKDRQDLVVKELNKREKDLRKELNDRKTAVGKLDVLIADIVRKEVERSKTLSTSAQATEEQRSSLFEENKNKLGWPVSSGFISSHFGKHPHPIIKNIIEDNPGVEIQTSQDAEVKSVFEGSVVAVAIVPGMNNMVLLKHGEYYTLYARLRTVHVKRGQLVKADEVLGEVYTDKDGISELHFEVWKEFTKLNPEGWLATK